METSSNTAKPTFLMESVAKRRREEDIEYSS